MRDSYRANQAGIQGPNAGSHANITQVYGEQTNEEYNYSGMIKEVARMREYLKSHNNDDEQDILIGELAKLNKALEQRDQNKISDFLKNAGKQVLDIAKRIGCPIIVAFIKNQLGL